VYQNHLHLLDLLVRQHGDELQRRADRTRLRRSASRKRSD